MKNDVISEKCANERNSCEFECEAIENYLNSLDVQSTTWEFPCYCYYFQS